MTTTEVDPGPAPEPERAATTSTLEPGSADAATGAFATEAAPPKRAKLPYFAGLDGMRGLGALFVAVYHAGYTSIAAGAFLAVSMFFTLSGFLITSLILREIEGSGTIDVRRFFLHRFRRLMPAAYVGIFLALAFGFFAANSEQLVTLRNDVLSAQFYVANWNFVASNQAYAELFNSASPLLHFWSLAIEEQFYLVYPLVIILCLKWLKMSVRSFGYLVAGLFVVSALLPHVIDMTSDRFYYGTDARGAELLAGVLLAIALSKRSLADPGWSDGTKRTLGGLGLVAFVITVLCWIIIPREHPVVYNSGLAVYAGVTVLLVLGCLVQGSLVGKILGVPVLAGLGKISYGVYVYHWPIYIWLDEERLGLPQFPLFLVRFSVTLLLAIASYFLLEIPIRKGQRPFKIRNWQAAVAAGVVIVVLALVLGTKAPDVAKASDELSGPLDNSRVSSVGQFVPPPTTLPTTTTQPGQAAVKPLEPKKSQRPSRPLRMLVVGDSAAVSLADALSTWGTDNRVFATISGGVRGCGIVRGGQKLQLYKNQEVILINNPDNCDWYQKWARQLQNIQPDLIVVSSSLWDTTDHVLPTEKSAPLRGPGDPAYDQWVREEYTTLFNLLSTAQVPMLWLQQPPAEWGIGLSYQGKPFAASDPARMKRLNQLVAEVGKQYPLFRVVPYDAFYARWPGGVHDRLLRVDGIHPTMSDGGRADIVAAWLGPELLWTYWDVWAKVAPG